MFLDRNSTISPFGYIQKKIAMYLKIYDMLVRGIGWFGAFIGEKRE